MSKSASEDLEAQLHTRFRVAIAFVQGDLDVYQQDDAAHRLKISARTLRRDISRARRCQTFEEWRPKKRGPQKGRRRITSKVYAVVEERVYAEAAKKLNIAKLGRDLSKDLCLAGISATDVPSESTLERLVRDIEGSDPAHFALRRYARDGRHAHSVQLGSLETERPLQIVCIDHTPLDQRTFTVGEETFVVRPTATAAMDIHTSTCLAAFISLFPPNATTVSLCMALMATPKDPVLRKYGVPGEWEACGLPEILYVDGAAELTAKAVERGCINNGIQLRVGVPGRPERRAKMERLWGTLKSEVHSWDGTTLSNTVELKRHGGQKPPAWNLEEVQRRYLIAAMEYNNENYGGPKIPPIMQWREKASLAAVSRRMPRDPAHVFIDFLPHETRTVRFEGIKFENCFYRSGDIAKLRYEGVKTVEIFYDPRDVSQIWIPVDTAGYVAIPRVYPRGAPTDLYALRRWNMNKAAVAREKKDSALLLELRAVKSPSYFAGLRGELKPSAEQLQWMEEAARHPRGSRAPIPENLLPRADESPLDDNATSLPPHFNIPDFKPRMK